MVLFVQTDASELVEYSTVIIFFKSKLDFTSWIKQAWFNLKVQFPWMNFPLYFIVFQDVNKNVIIQIEKNFALKLIKLVTRNLRKIYPLYTFTKYVKF